MEEMTIREKLRLALWLRTDCTDSEILRGISKIQNLGIYDLSIDLGLKPGAGTTRIIIAVNNFLKHPNNQTVKLAEHILVANGILKRKIKMNKKDQFLDMAVKNFESVVAKVHLL